MRKLVICLLTVVLLAACTNKKNKIGFSDSDLNMRAVELGDSLLMNYYSYEDSTKAYSSNPYANVGICRGTRAVTLLRFYDIPDTNYSNIRLTLYSTDVSHGVGMTLHLGIVKQDWDENEVTWYESESGTDWSDPAHKYDPVADWSYVIPDADTLELPIPESLIATWNDDNDENYGIALYSEDPDGFLTFNTGYSSSLYPVLSYNYQVAGEDTLRTFKRKVGNDATIFDKSFVTTPIDAMEINSATPERMFVQYDLSLAAFRAAGVEFADSTQFRRTTINRAELILPVNAQDTYFSSTSAAAYALLVYGENPTLPIKNTNLKSFAYTDISYLTEDASTMSIDVTPLVQAITSGSYDNKGFLIKCYNESRDFTHIRFNPAGARLKVYYTLPYHED